MKIFFILALVSLTTSLAYSKDPSKGKHKNNPPHQKKKVPHPAKSGSWDDEDFQLKNDGRDVANEPKDDKENPTPKYWDYKED